MYLRQFFRQFYYRYLYLKYLKIQKIQPLHVSVSYLRYIFKVSSPCLTRPTADRQQVFPLRVAVLWLRQEEQEEDGMDGVVGSVSSHSRLGWQKKVPIRVRVRKETVSSSFQSWIPVFWGSATVRPIPKERSALVDFLDEVYTYVWIMVHFLQIRIFVYST